MSNDKNVTPFGEYGILIRDIRQSNICKPDMTKLKDADYLFQRGCSFDVYKWNGEKYIPSLYYNGNDYSKASHNSNASPFDSLMPMHVWLESLEDLQKWLGEYYEAAIACMLAPEKKSKKKTSDVEDAINEIFKRSKPYDDYYKDALDQYDKTWKTDVDWTTNTSNTFNDDVNTKLDNMIQKAKTWKAIK